MRCARIRRLFAADVSLSLVKNSAGGVGELRRRRCVAAPIGLSVTSPARSSQRGHRLAALARVVSDARLASRAPRLPVVMAAASGALFGSQRRRRLVVVRVQ